MVKAFGRLLGIFVLTLLTLYCLVYNLHRMGEAQEYAALNHPLLTGQPWVIAWGGNKEQAPAFSLEAYKALSQNGESKFWLGLVVRQSVDGEWFVFPDKTLDQHSNTKGFFSHQSANEVRKIHFQNSAQYISSLEEIFSNFPKSKYFVEIGQPATPELAGLFSLIEKYNLRQNVVLTSSFITTMKEVRDKSYEWLTGSTASEVARARFMSSLYLEPLITLPGEVIVIDKVNARLDEELQKRHRIVLFKTDEPALYNSLLNEKLIQGVITTRPVLFSQVVDSHKF